MVTNSHCIYARPHKTDNKDGDILWFNQVISTESPRQMDLLTGVKSFVLHY